MQRLPKLPASLAARLNRRKQARTERRQQALGKLKSRLPAADETVGVQDPITELRGEQRKSRR